jgi:hypothetical protein
VLTDRLLADVEDEVEATVERDILRRTAKKNQMEHTLSALRKNIADHQKKVDKAKALKIELGARDLRYRKNNFNLYHSIFDYIPLIPGESYPRFFQIWSESEEILTYQIDFKVLDAAIATREKHAYMLASMVVTNDAALLIDDTLVMNAIYTRRLHDFKKTLQKNQLQIERAIALYQETLLHLEKLTDELDHNEDILKQVLIDLEDLEAMKARCKALEETYGSPKP